MTQKKKPMSFGKMMGIFAAVMVGIMVIAAVVLVSMSGGKKSQGRTVQTQAQPQTAQIPQGPSSAELSADNRETRETLDALQAQLQLQESQISNTDARLKDEIIRLENLISATATNATAAAAKAKVSVIKRENLGDSTTAARDPGMQRITQYNGYDVIAVIGDTVWVRAHSGEGIPVRFGQVPPPEARPR